MIRLFSLRVNTPLLAALLLEISFVEIPRSLLRGVSLLTDEIFLRRCISFIETAAVAIPPKINPIQKEVIITGSILKTFEDEFYNY